MAYEPMFTEEPTSFEGGSYSSEEKRLNLIPLTPESRLSAKNPAIKALFEAYEDSRIRNIAITGPYGAGKSSVIASFIKWKGEPHKFIGISISSIASADKSANDNFNLEREISKQILNFNPTGKIGQPRNSLKSSNFSKLLSDSLVAALALILVVVTLSFTKIGPFSSWDPGITELLVLSLGITSVVLLGGYFLASKQLVARISTGVAEVDFEKQSSSSFDEYSAELVRFFQNRPETTIVFEDIDRFDDPSIFDRLHDLNALLNSATGVDACHEPIRFIYALKESIFEDGNISGGATKKEVAPYDLEASSRSETAEELERSLEAFSESSRRKTKFFDLVIPVLPLVNQTNSFGQLSIALSERGIDISYPLVAHVSDYVMDQRLITNIVNEYQILKSSLSFPKVSHYSDHRRYRNDPESLDRDRVFAVVAYKNLFPRDFEKSQFGESTLDRILARFNNLKFEQLNAEIRKNKEQFKATDKDYISIFRQFCREVLSAALEPVREERIDGENWRPNRLSNYVFTFGEIKISLSFRNQDLIKQIREIPREFNLSELQISDKNDEGVTFDPSLIPFETWGSFRDAQLKQLESRRNRQALRKVSELLSISVHRGLVKNTQGIWLDRGVSDFVEQFQSEIPDDDEIVEFLTPLIISRYLDFSVSGITKRGASKGLKGTTFESGLGFRKLKRILDGRESVSSDVLTDTGVLAELFSFADGRSSQENSLWEPIVDTISLTSLQAIASIELLGSPLKVKEILSDANSKGNGIPKWTVNLVDNLVSYESPRFALSWSRYSLNATISILWQALSDDPTRLNTLKSLLADHGNVKLVKEVSYYLDEDLRTWVRQELSEDHEDQKLFEDNLQILQDSIAASELVDKKREKRMKLLKARRRTIKSEDQHDLES